jgi:hypothetical protein
MRTFKVRIKPSIAKRLDFSTEILTITQEDFFGVIKRTLKVQVKGANPRYPNNYADFSIDELIFEDSAWEEINGAE